MCRTINELIEYLNNLITSANHSKQDCIFVKKDLFNQDELDYIDYYSLKNGKKVFYE